MPFDTIESQGTRQERRRTSQRDLLPKAVKLRNSEIYQLGPQTIIIYDRANNEVIAINQDSTRLEFGSTSWYVDYSTGNAVFNNITGITNDEIHLALADFFVWENRLTNSGTYATITDAGTFDINFDKFPGYSAYFEVIAKTDDGTAAYQLYDVDAAAAVTGSEVTTSSTTTVTIRSGAITKPSGTATLAIQHKKTGGIAANYANIISAQLIFD